MKVPRNEPRPEEHRGSPRAGESSLRLDTTQVQVVQDWSQFNDFVHSLPGEWAYRGQTHDWPLRTSLERALVKWEALAEGPSVEQQIIRDFRRRYRGEAENRVSSDTLYCLALMQHHGAPTRLLDFTYSPFVAAKFALETGARDGVVWCINTAWCHQNAVEVAGEAVTARNIDSSRDDGSFLPMYMGNTGTGLKFIMAENSMQLNERLIIQQGVFMCPRDVGAGFEENLEAMKDWNCRGNLIKMRFDLSRDEAAHFVVTLRRMNITSAVLFPGLDGFARSLGEMLPLYLDMARREIGTENFKIGSIV